MLSILVSSLRGDTPVATTISLQAAVGSNEVLLVWHAQRGKSYVVKAVDDLQGKPWQLLTPTPLVAPTNRLSWQEPITESSRFYQVVKLDTEAPNAWHRCPGDGAVGVPRQLPLRIWLDEETSVEPASMRLTF